MEFERDLLLTNKQAPNVTTLKKQHLETHQINVRNTKTTINTGTYTQHTYCKIENTQNKRGSNDNFCSLEQQEEEGEISECLRVEEITRIGKGNLNAE